MVGWTVCQLISIDPKTTTTTTTMVCRSEIYIFWLLLKWKYLFENGWLCLSHTRDVICPSPRTVQQRQQQQKVKRINEDDTQQNTPSNSTTIVVVQLVCVCVIPIMGHNRPGGIPPIQPPTSSFFFVNIRDSWLRRGKNKLLRGEKKEKSASSSSSSIFWIAKGNWSLRPLCRYITTFFAFSPAHQSFWHRNIFHLKRATAAKYTHKSRLLLLLYKETPVFSCPDYSRKKNISK